MKRNLIKGIVLISAVVLSSCSATNKFAGVKNTRYNDDDVYYTMAKAGDSPEDIANNQNNYTRDDDYYYYGDYATRLNRFSNYSPFDYDDDFYFSYVPYNNGFGAGLDYNLDYYGYNYGFNNTANPVAAIDNGNIYSPYNYGYSPYDDMGYDDYGFGDIYSSYIGGGGGGGGYGSARLWHHNKTTTVAATSNPNARGARTTPSPGVIRLNSLPGRPLVGLNSSVTGVAAINSLNGNNTASRQTRESYRPAQQQSIAPPPSSSNTSSGGSTSSGASSGGGGRPVRP